MLKNIIIINDFDYVQGGASKVAIDTANLLCDTYRVYFFSGDTRGNNALDKKIMKICTNQGESLKNKNKLLGAVNGIYNFKAKRELEKLLIKLDKDETIIHVHGWTKCLSSSIFNVCWKHDFKVVLTLHDYFTACPNGGYFNYKSNEICHLNPLSLKCIKCNCDSRNYMFKIYRIIRQFVQNKIVKLNDKLTDVISISEFSEKILKSTLNNKVTIHRIYNPIDFKKGENNNYSKSDYFLYVGRVSQEKGVNIFCEILNELNLRGIVVGDGPEKVRLERKYPDINFVGWKEKEDVVVYMKKAKALIFPSLWYETAGLTVLEAQACNTICIVNSNCAASEFINDDCYVYHNYNELKAIVKKVSNFKKISTEINYTQDFETYKRNVVEIYEKII